MWLLVVFGVLIFSVFLFFNTPKGKGIIGEYRVNKILKKLALKYGGIEFRDFMLEDERSSSQIDNMLITQKALYVIEVKNYKGMIFGSEDNMDWTVTIKHVNKKRAKSGRVYKKTNISKHKFYNPIKQNRTHINKIKNLTNIYETIPIFNIVVFGKRAIIRNVTHSKEVHVICERYLKKTVYELEESIASEITLDLQTEIVETLFDINITDKKRRKQHVKDLKKKYK